MAAIVLTAFDRNLNVSDTSGPGRKYKAELLSSTGPMPMDVIIWGPDDLRQNVTINDPYVVVDSRYTDGKVTGSNIL